MNCCQSQDSGYVLIEVLIAFTILAGALGFLQLTINHSINNVVTATQQHNMLQAAKAVRLMAENAPVPSDQAGRLNDIGIEWTYKSRWIESLEFNAQTRAYRIDMVIRHIPGEKTEQFQSVTYRELR